MKQKLNTRNNYPVSKHTIGEIPVSSPIPTLLTTQFNDHTGCRTTPSQLLAQHSQQANYVQYTVQVPYNYQNGSCPVSSIYCIRHSVYDHMAFQSRQETIPSFLGHCFTMYLHGCKMKSEWRPENIRQLHTTMQALMNIYNLVFFWRH